MTPPKTAQEAPAGADTSHTGSTDPRSAPMAELRPPAQVMRLERMGCSFPTRISFARTLIRRLHAEAAEVTRPVWRIDAEGYGRAVYAVTLGGCSYSLVAFSQPLDATDRTDRVIAEAWDTSYILFDGIPTEAEVNRLEAEAPRQEAGRYRAKDLVISRANKSVRMFEHVVDRLSRGQQPDADRVTRIGYLMRTTAVYGNGKFGAADRARLADRPALAGPFQVELLAVWLIRGFTHDLAEHIAFARDPARFQPLDPDLKRHLGVGNATGLGMAPFLTNHPVLIHHWAAARETALARVRGIRMASTETSLQFRRLVERTQAHLAEWNIDDEPQMKRIEHLRQEVAALDRLATLDWLAEPRPWDRLIADSGRGSLEYQELVAALVLEPHGDLVDGIEHCMASDIHQVWKPEMRLDELRSIVEQAFDWALEIDFTSRPAERWFWYVSKEKLEPRLGDRFDEPGADRELPLDVARCIQAMAADLQSGDAGETVAEFVMRHPEHRYAAKRAQTLARYPYAEIRDNLIGETCLPIDILRWKLAFFGATKFDPKSDRWTRIALFQGAPVRETVGDPDADDWLFPTLAGRE